VGKPEKGGDMKWKKIKLGEVLKNREGRYKPNDPKIAGLKRIDKINFLGQIFLSDKPSNTDMILVKKGDLVISGINVEKGALAVYEGEEDILATIHYSSYIFDTTKIDIDFLKIFLRSPDFVQLLKEQVPGGIKTEIKPKHILPLEVYFPETTEEQKIIAAHFFEKEVKLNQLQKQLSHQLTLLDQLEQAILQEAVQGKLVPQDLNDEPASELLKRIKAEKLNGSYPSGRRKKEKPLPPIKPEEIPYEIPENWVWCRLGEICEINPRNNIIDDNIDAGFIPMQMISHLFGVKPTFEVRKWGYIKSGFTHFANNDVVVAKITPCFENSKAGIITDLPNGIGAGTTELNVLRGNQYVLPEYIYAFVKRIDFLKNGERIMKGVAGQQRVPTDYFYNTIIPLPPLSEQKRIVAEIERQFAKTKQLKEHIIANQQATKQLLKALLHQAFEVKENEENLAKA
jgi:type I restriction enzyme S subunit